MKFLLFETNSLSSVAEKNGEFKWENIGSTPKLIKLSDVTTARGNQTTGKTSYVIPIADEAKANEFILEAQKYGVTVMIADEAEAQVKKGELLSQPDLAVTEEELKQRVTDLELQVATLTGGV